MLLVIAFFLVVVFGGGIALVVFVARAITKPRRNVDALTAEVRAGALPGLIHWDPSLLRALSCDWVGASHFVRGAFGHRDASAGTVWVPGFGGPVLGFACELDRASAGSFAITTSVARFVGYFDRGTLWVAVGGATLGGVVLEGGTILDATGQVIGQFARDGVQFGQVYLRGRSLGAVAPRGDSHVAMPAAPRPLFANLDVRSAEEEAWMLVVAVLELGCFGVMRTHAGMRHLG